MRLDGATPLPPRYFFPSLNICLYPTKKRVGKRIAPEGCQSLIKKPFGLRRGVILSSSPAFTDNAQSLKLSVENYSESGERIQRKVSRRETSRGHVDRKFASIRPRVS